METKKQKEEKAKEKYKKDKKKLSGLIIERDNCDRDIIKLNKLITSTAIRIDVYTKMLSDTKYISKIEEDIKMIRKRKDIESVKITEDIIYIYTKEIKTKDKRGPKSNLGKFVITIDKNKDIDISNLKPKKRSEGSPRRVYRLDHHPHIVENVSDGRAYNKRICYGSWSPAINRMKKKNFFMLVLILMRFLKSYNRVDPYYRL